MKSDVLHYYMCSTVITSIEHHKRRTDPKRKDIGHVTEQLTKTGSMQGDNQKRKSNTTQDYHPRCHVTWRVPSCCWCIGQTELTQLAQGGCLHRNPFFGATNTVNKYHKARLSSRACYL